MAAGEFVPKGRYLGDSTTEGLHTRGLEVGSEGGEGRVREGGETIEGGGKGG